MEVLAELSDGLLHRIRKMDAGRIDGRRIIRAVGISRALLVPRLIRIGQRVVRWQGAANGGQARQGSREKLGIVGALS